jgi:Tfp pilus assembly protein PilN
MLLPSLPSANMVAPGALRTDDRMMAERRPRRSWDLVGIATLVALLLLLLGGWLVFPRLQNEIAWQDCVASGRMNCGK